MGNNWFHFKEFTITQNDTGFRVTTEACIFGAIIDTAGAQSILDIGTGTGLIALMLAQKEPFAQLEAIEIDTSAANMAHENFKNSQWLERLKIIRNDIRNYANLGAKSYDLIVSNPPFYPNYLKSSSTNRNQAMHNTSLSHEELSDAINALLSENGTAWILLPSNEADNFRNIILKRQLFVTSAIKIYNFIDQVVFRKVLVIKRTQAVEYLEKEFVIYDGQKQYTQEFVNLLKPFYNSL